jgi:hypothetical protein
MGHLTKTTPFLFEPEPVLRTLQNGARRGTLASCGGRKPLVSEGVALSFDPSAAKRGGEWCLMSEMDETRTETGA